MLRRFRSLSLVAAVMALVAGGAAVYTQGPGEPGGHRMRGFGGGFPLRELDLTDAQRQQVREVMQRHRDEMREAGQRLGQAFAAQRKAVEAIPVNEGLIRSTTQELSAAQTDMAILHARIHSEVFSLLTPEQQEKARELRAERESRMNERRHRFEQRRQRPPQDDRPFGL